jgi:hypothetical protein
MVVEYFPKDKLCNHTDDVEEAYLHFFFQINLNTSCSGLEEP